MAKPGRSSKYRLAAVVFASGGFVLSYAIGSGSSATSVSISNPNEISERITLSEEPAQDYSRFQHKNPQHARLPCLLCHKRDDNSAAPKFSGHLPCAGCHKEQFADNKNSICTICHTETGLKRFPGLSSFNVRFDHAKHKQATCATCHKSSRGGVALSIPSGANAHVTCYQCHGPRTESGGSNIGSCSVCHQPGRPVRTSDRARAFAVNFNHAEHRSARGLNCSSCHTVRAGLPRGRQVSSPLASMHFAPARAPSCANCHNNARAFGGNDFSDCKRCHEGRTFKF